MIKKFINARLITMEGKPEVIENGTVIVKDDKILFAGKGEDASKAYDGDADIENDCKGNILMPGFKNAHTHTAMTLMRSYADGLPLQDWLTQKIFPLEAKFTGEQIYTFTKLGILEYLTSGITACFDMYLAPEETARACSDMGFRCVQCGNVNNFSSSVENMERLYDSLNNSDPLNSYILGCHAEYTCSEELLKDIASLAEKKKAPVFLHANETKKEVDECEERHGKKVITYLDSLGLFNYGGGIYHGVHVTDEEMDILEKKNISVVLNPGSNTKLASGIAPVTEYLKRGINTALGTDGPSSNNCLDMFREMFLATGLSKLRDGNASAVPAEEVLKMATVNGSDCMGLENARTLTAGQQADMVMLDMHAPNMRPVNDVLSNIVYSGSKSNVLMTMVAGRILYESGEFPHCDKEKIYSEAENIQKELGLL
ncbi:MAG: amidohydrolase [Lachnospiraceae bacterium]|nr:amidohydrolase [Lachnospiraceae bacterium]